MDKLQIHIAILVVLLTLFSSCTNENGRFAKHMESAKRHIAENRLRSATIELRNAIQADPENDHAHYLLGETYIKLKDQKRGIFFYRRAAELNPDNLDAQLKMGQILIKDDMLFDARTIASKVMKVSPDNIEAHHLLAVIQIKERDVEAAISTMKKAVALAPQSFKPNMFLAHIYDTTGKKELAEQAYLKTISLDSSQRAPYYELSIFYIKNKQWKKAEDLLKRVSLTPGIKALKYTDLAKFYEKRKKLNLAEKNYLNAVASAPQNLDPLMNIAEFYVRINKMDKAVNEMNKALTLKKEIPEVLKALAQIYFHFKNIEKAQEYVDQALEMDEELIGALDLKGRILMHEKNFSGAFDQFHKVIKIDQYNARAYYYKAVCIKKKGGNRIQDQDIYRAAAGLLDTPELFEAKMIKDHLRTATLLDPEFIDAKIRLTEIYLAEKELIKAREQIEKILNLKPRGFKILSLLSELKLLEGDVKSAEEFCKLVLRQNPDYAPGHIRLGLVYRAWGKNSLALKSFKRALELHPDKAKALKFMVDIYLKQKRYDDALAIIEQYKSSVDTEQQAMIMHLKGDLFLKKGEKDKALNYFKKSMERDPNYLPACISLAGLLIRRQLYEDASLLYEKVLAKEPDHIPALMAMGYLYDIQGASRKAEARYRKILKIDPEHVNAANNLAFILSETEEGIEEAFSLARQARKRKPKDPNVLDTMGWLYYKRGRYKNAVSEFKESLEFNPENPVTCYHLGLAYYRTQKYELARTYLQKAIDIDPNFNGAATARELLNQ